MIRKITEVGSEEDLRVIFSPGFYQDKNYPDKTLVMYNIKCPADKPFAYFNTTDLVLQGECEDTYVDTYAMVTVV